MTSSQEIRSTSVFTSLRETLGRVEAAAGRMSARFDPWFPLLLESRWTLAAICALGLVLRVAEALIFPGFEFPDEIFQVLEQAHRLVFGYGFIPWEFDEGIRSYLLPGAMAGIFRLGEMIRPGSYLLAARVALSLSSLLTVWFAWVVLRRFATPRAAVIGAFLCAVWFELVYFGPKAHSEVVAGHLLLLATYLVFPYIAEIGTARLLAGGFLLGLTFCLRIQLGLTMAVLGLTILFVNGWRRMAITVAGAIAGVAASGVVDYFTLPYPYASILGYYKVNIIDHVSTIFGASPWYYMLLNFPRVWSGALVLFLWFGFEGTRKSKPMLLLVAMAGALVLAHSIPAHKEYRYEYPALPLLMVPIALGMDRVISRLYGSRRFTLAATLAGIAVLSLVIGSSRNFREHFYRQYAETKAFQAVRARPDACGVMLHLVHWGETPFYTVLHRNIPIYDDFRGRNFDRFHDAANYVLSREPLQGYTKLNLWETGDDPLYLYRRDGGCTDRLLGERLLVDKRARWKDRYE